MTDHSSSHAEEQDGIPGADQRLGGPSMKPALAEEVGNPTTLVDPPVQAAGSSASQVRKLAFGIRLAQVGEYFPLVTGMLGEFVGTFILVFFGIGSVHTAVATGAQVGLWQVAVVWAVAVSLAIYSTASLSGAHLNPAMTLMTAVYARFPWRWVAPFMVSQVAGAMAAALVLHGLFGGIITEFERVKGLVRGGPGSELSAMMYGEYFPNPAIFGTSLEAYRVVTLFVAFAAEAIGTAALGFFVRVLTDTKNPTRPLPWAAPVMIGLVVALIISVVAPITQAGLNPARDFGPRLVAYYLGWGPIAIPGPRGGWLTVYILGPLLGGLVGGGIYAVLAYGMPGRGPSNDAPERSARPGS